MLLLFKKRFYGGAYVEGAIAQVLEEIEQSAEAIRFARLVQLTVSHNDAIDGNVMHVDVMDKDVMHPTGISVVVVTPSKED